MGRVVNTEASIVSVSLLTMVIAMVSYIHISSIQEMDNVIANVQFVKFIIF